MTLSKFGYGIIDGDGNQYWSEMCVCEDRVPLDDEVQLLNEDLPKGEGKFRVVALYRKRKTK